MRADVVVKRFDDLGRIVIPKEIRRKLFGTPEKSEGMPMEIFMDGDNIILRKYEVKGLSLLRKKIKVVE